MTLVFIALLALSWTGLSLAVLAMLMQRMAPPRQAAWRAFGLSLVFNTHQRGLCLAGGAARAAVLLILACHALLLPPLLLAARREERRRPDAQPRMPPGLHAAPIGRTPPRRRANSRPVARPLPLLSR